MGDEILKKYVLTAISCLYLNATAITEEAGVKEDLKRFDSLFEQISKKRSGINQAVINSLKDPFVYKREIKKIAKTKNGKTVKEVPKKAALRLLAIFNRKAKINDKWYRERDRVGNYKILRIKENFVVLRDGGKTIKLFLRKRDDKIKITVH